MWPGDPAPGDVHKEFREPPPHNKHVTVTLLYLKSANVYYVHEITNTNWYKPGDWLSDEIIAGINRTPGWETKIDNLDAVKTALSYLQPFASLLNKLPIP
jgi:hypothetical protein